MTFDVELLGDCDVIITELCQRLGGAWNNLLEGVEIPDLERRPLSRNEENTTGEMHQGVNFEEIQRSEQVHAEYDRTYVRRKVQHLEFEIYSVQQMSKSLIILTVRS